MLGKWKRDWINFYNRTEQSALNFDFPYHKRDFISVVFEAQQDKITNKQISLFLFLTGKKYWIVFFKEILKEKNTLWHISEKW